MPKALVVSGLITPSAALWTCSPTLANSDTHTSSRALLEEHNEALREASAHLDPRCAGKETKRKTVTKIRLSALTLFQVLPVEASVFRFVDGRGSGHLGPAVGLKTLSIHECICPHFGM